MTCRGKGELVAKGIVCVTGALVLHEVLNAAVWTCWSAILSGHVSLIMLAYTLLACLRARLHACKPLMLQLTWSDSAGMPILQ